MMLRGVSSGEEVSEAKGWGRSARGRERMLFRLWMLRVEAGEGERGGLGWVRLSIFGGPGGLGIGKWFGFWGVGGWRLGLRGVVGGEMVVWWVDREEIRGGFRLGKAFLILCDLLASKG